jgi:uncharacterized protein
MFGFLASVFSNKIILSVIWAYVFASLLKMAFHYIGKDEWDWMIFFRTGGMPSSHTASIVAMTTSVYLQEGPSSLFMVCIIVSGIVISDAIGLRRAVGKQAQTLNQMADEIRHFGKLKTKRLQELLGHTPRQAIGGLILGIVVAHIVQWMI